MAFEKGEVQLVGGGRMGEGGIVVEVGVKEMVHGGMGTEMEENGTCL
jgi:hypothetical protein